MASVKNLYEAKDRPEEFTTGLIGGFDEFSEMFPELVKPWIEFWASQDIEDHDDSNSERFWETFFAKPDAMKFMRTETGYGVVWALIKDDFGANEMALFFDDLTDTWKARDLDNVPSEVERLYRQS